MFKPECSTRDSDKPRKASLAALTLWCASLTLLLVTAPPARAATPTVRTSAQVDALIDQAGRSRPDWWEQVALEYPKTLDLSWPARPTGGWNANRNVGQYMWSIINENPSRWKSGTKFMHHMLGVNKSNPEVLNRAIGQLAHCYQDLLRDWPRAAFWRKMQVQRDSRNVNARIRLAECYWKLGSKAKAESELRRVSGTIHPAMIKLWADMGELARALSVAEKMARYYPAMSYLAAGDACRLQGSYTKALSYYRKVLAIRPVGQMAKQTQVMQVRARASVEVITQFEALDLKRVRDGTHKGTAMSYAGPLEVAVTVSGGKIISVKVTRHKDKQFFGAITETPAQIVAKQHVKGVDAVSGATITSNAVINATARALAAAKK